MRLLTKVLELMADGCMATIYECRSRDARLNMAAYIFINVLVTEGRTVDEAVTLIKKTWEENE